MKTSQYLAVFKSLSYAGHIRNRFWSANKPEIIKTPKNLLGGCSYALSFSEEQLKEIMHLTKNRKQGFLGIYRLKPNGRYEEVTDDLPG